MGTTLNWDYQHNGEHAGEYHAFHNGYRIRAVLDDSPSNPFKDQDGNWPMLVRYDGRVTLYEKTGGCGADNPLAYIPDALLIHDQIAIAKLLGTTIEAITEPYDDGVKVVGPVKYLNDADWLRIEFQNILDDGRESEKFETYKALFAIAGITAHCADSRGHSQGDYAEVLVVATPEAIEKFGCTQPITEADLEGTVKLYSAWAWGDVYGYVIEKRAKTGAAITLDRGGATEEEIAHLPSLEEAEDFLATSATIDPELLDAGAYSVCDYDDPDAEGVWEELDSCWGFYGSDFDWSGLEEAAMDACPKEKVDA